MFRMILCLLLTLLLTPAPGSGAPAPPAGVDSLRAEIQAFVKAFVDAANKADVSATMEMYSRSAGVTSIGDGEIARGWDAIREDSDEVIGKEGTYKFSVGSIDVLRLGPTHALAVAPYSLTVLTGQDAAQLSGAMTIVLERSGGKWLILHDHLSTRAPEEESD